MEWLSALVDKLSNFFCRRNNINHYYDKIKCFYGEYFIGNSILTGDELERLIEIYEGVNIDIKDRSRSLIGGNDKLVFVRNFQRKANKVIVTYQALQEFMDQEQYPVNGEEKDKKVFESTMNDKFNDYQSAFSKNYNSLKKILDEEFGTK